jgi:ribosomal protein S18 acetylase RimI-like enzyme
VRLRVATASDATTCAALDGTYTTSHIWQLETRTEGDDLRVTFRPGRLPRPLTLVAEHRPPLSSAGTLQRDVLWLVAEEVVLEPDPDTASKQPDATEPDHAGQPGESRGQVTMDHDQPRGRAVTAAGARSEGRPAAGAAGTRRPPLWSDMMRRASGISTVQLGLPAIVAEQMEPLPRRQLPSPTTARTAPATASTVVRPSSAPGGLGSSTAETSGDARIVGYIAVSAPPGDQTAYLRALAVDTSYRRRGIGSRLLAAAERWVVQQRAEQLMTDVPARNYPAIRLLQKSGFAICGFNDRCYPNQEVALFFSARLR